MIKITQDNKTECCGCGACMQICPKKCITMKKDREGFAYPAVDRDACIDCGRCEKVCPVIQKDIQYKKSDEEPMALGGWHKDDAVREDSSSGGAFSLFALDVLRSGGMVFGAVMGDDLRVCHIGIDKEEELTRLRGSKYVQSDIKNVYIEVRDHLKTGRPVLFSGTPCQAAGLSSFLGKKYDNLYIIDFICHGVPSPGVFRKYLKYLEKKTGDEICSYRFRLKDKGWHPSGLQLGTAIRTKKGLYIRNYPALRDGYMNGFLDDVYLRPSCYDCRFKCIPKYYADITIADFWGVKNVDPELYDGKGTSLLLIHSEQGRKLFERTKQDFYYKPCDYHKSIRRNQTLIRSVDPNPHREQFFKDLKEKPFEKIVSKYMSPAVWVFHKSMKIIRHSIGK